ncbi:6-phosphofructo-2-kinase 1 [Nannizzia gypsea CBS 118893]|uniref:6-phosphofructo-2-kinase 1 n=1 Tax=Arthroderma gypseum (strain ATCC MYA-4604 / CBS 118893) TaxID=535722 RepID=E4UZ63_ARTGP|nr:6-phosphofructo-2-kinase 1 [Nannizzia gypsea CBS 118893]EFR03393.1 6-phosphofructo-2-kinase 1 [Nannizzia gypsea CBS 118893]
MAAGQQTPCQHQHSHLARAVVVRNSSFSPAPSPASASSTSSTSSARPKKNGFSSTRSASSPLAPTSSSPLASNGDGTAAASSSSMTDIHNHQYSPSGTPSPPPAATPVGYQHHYGSTLAPPAKTVVGRALGIDRFSEPQQRRTSGDAAAPGGLAAPGCGISMADTPLSSAPASPQMTPRSYGSGASTPGKHRATTLDIPGLTKSKVSPDGRIAQRDIGSKLVIVMVGLPARGKSYITKKLCRYLNWLQHDTKIFNVGERRRTVASSTPQTEPKKIDPIVDEKLRKSVRELSIGELHPEEQAEFDATQKNISTPPDGVPSSEIPPLEMPPSSIPPAQILVNGKVQDEPPEKPEPASGKATPSSANGEPDTAAKAEEGMDQSAQFFDPDNQRAVQLREQVALATLDELLDYILEQGGSAGILDATNSTLERRKSVMARIRERAGPELNVLFLESCCYDAMLLESNMRLKLSGPDYKDMEPVVALEDFKKRIKLYERSYVPLGEYEEHHNMPYVQTIDVCRKVVAHQATGFMASQVVSYLLNFNLSPRQIWISRHGESLDDISGRIGGNAPLSENGTQYARALAKFIDHQRARWEEYQKIKALSTHFPPRPGDSTPPNPQYAAQIMEGGRNFCVWTSMLTRCSQTAQFFDEEEYDIKEMRMLNELNAGVMEGLTYDEIRERFPSDFETRRKEKLHYRFPGPGGEGYLDVVNRLRAVIVEVERMTDHVLLVGPRSVARTLLGYFLGLRREDLTDLAVPMGIIYSLEPKPYGVEYKVYQYDPKACWFDELPNYKIGQKSYY